MKTKKILIFSLLLLTIIPFTFALDSIGTVKQNECINISQMCSTCSYVNISSIGTKDNSNIISNQPMSYFGNGEWRYEFCNTSEIDRYNVKGQGDINGVDSNFATYFDVTPLGNEISLEKSLLSLGLIIIILILFILSVRGLIITEDFGWKFGFLNVAYLLFNIFLFITWKISQSYLYEIQTLSTAIHSIWIVSNIIWVPFILAQVFYLLLKMTDSSEIKKLMGRGYTEEEARNKIRRKK